MPAAQGVSGIAIDGDVEAGQQYVPRATAMLRRLSERVQLGGIQTVSDFVRLADNAYCYAVVSGALKRAVIVVDAASQTQPPTQPTRTPVVVPDFLSGAVMEGTITTPPKPPPPKPPLPRYVDAFWPTEDCAKLFHIPTDTQTSTRLAVDPFSEFQSVLSAPESSPFVYSQYVKLKPTMYSGRMRQVVQLLMGFGFQNKKSVYDKTPPKMTTTAQDNTAKVTQTQYQTDVIKKGLQIRYDWRWYRTHGIGVGRDGALYLVEIGNTRGALVMPLAVNAITQKTAFRTKLTKMHDAAGLSALDELGAFPTGESFPSDQLDSWIRAGAVMRMSSVDDLDQFYSLNAPSSMYGWAFNHSGNEAHNIAQSFDANGVLWSSHFGYSFTIGAANKITPPSNAQSAKAAIHSKSKDPRYPAVIFKIDRMAHFDLELLLAHYSLEPDNLFEALDAATVPPVATASGHLWQESSGALYKVGRTTQYNLKYPSPELGYLLSVNMQAPHPPRLPCDTDVHVFYVGDELKICRFFNDLRTAPPPAIADDNDGCELIGTFTRTVTTGSTFVNSGVYTTDYDDRRELNGARSVTVTTCKSLGYCQISCNDDIIAPEFASCSRQKRFRRDIDTQSWTGEGVDGAIVVPFYDRCAYYYAMAQSQTQHSESTQTVFLQEVDPWSAVTWRNFPGYTGHVIGNVYVRAQHPDGCGPVDARTAMHPTPIYSPYTCSDFSDSGPWCHVCDNIDSMSYTIPPPPPVPGTNTNAGFMVTRRTYLVNESPLTPLNIEIKVFTDPFGGAENPWFIMSPDPDTGDTQYAEVTHNTLGDSTALRYSHDPSSGIDVRGAPLPPGWEKGSPTTIGVF